MIKDLANKHISEKRTIELTLKMILGEKSPKRPHPKALYEYQDSRLKVVSS